MTTHGAHSRYASTHTLYFKLFIAHHAANERVVSTVSTRIFLAQQAANVPDVGTVSTIFLAQHAVNEVSVPLVQGSF